jgi:hypothetical protein
MCLTMPSAPATVGLVQSRSVLAWERLGGAAAALPALPPRPPIAAAAPAAKLPSQPPAPSPPSQPGRGNVVLVGRGSRGAAAAPAQATGIVTRRPQALDAQARKPELAAPAPQPPQLKKRGARPGGSKGPPREACAVCKAALHLSAVECRCTRGRLVRGSPTLVSFT